MAEFNCINCKYGMTTDDYEHCGNCDKGSNFVKMTNAERIRSMSDEELHNFIRAIRCCTRYGADCGYPFCHSMKGNLCNGIKDNKNEELLKWLQSEAE